FRAAAEAYSQLEQQFLAQRSQQAEQARSRGDAELRREFAGDYSGAIARAQGVLRQAFGDQAEQITELELADGTRLGDPLAFFGGRARRGLLLGGGAAPPLGGAPAAGARGGGISLDGEKEERARVEGESAAALYNKGDPMPASGVTRRSRAIARFIAAGGR